MSKVSGRARVEPEFSVSSLPSTFGVSREALGWRGGWEVELISQVGVQGPRSGARGEA